MLFLPISVGCRRFGRQLSTVFVTMWGPGTGKKFWKFWVSVTAEVPLVEFASIKQNFSSLQTDYQFLQFPCQAIQQFLTCASISIFFAVFCTFFFMCTCSGVHDPVYLSNKPQVSMVYRLINHAGCWKNTRRIRKSRAAGE